MSLRWHVEGWRKIYITKSPSWLRLPVSARGLGRELLTYADDFGRIDVGDEDPGTAVAFLLGARPKEHKRIAEDVSELLREGYLRHDGTHLVIRNFVEAQDRTPGAKRTSEWRARKNATHKHTSDAAETSRVTDPETSHVTSRVTSLCDASETSPVTSLGDAGETSLRDGGVTAIRSDPIRSDPIEEEKKRVARVRAVNPIGGGGRASDPRPAPKPEPQAEPQTTSPSQLALPSSDDPESLKRAAELRAQLKPGLKTAILKELKHPSFSFLTDLDQAADELAERAVIANKPAGAVALSLSRLATRARAGNWSVNRVEAGLVNAIDWAREDVSWSNVRELAPPPRDSDEDPSIAARAHQKLQAKPPARGEV